MTVYVDILHGAAAGQTHIYRYIYSGRWMYCLLDDLYKAKHRCRYISYDGDVVMADWEGDDKTLPITQRR